MSKPKTLINKTSFLVKIKDAREIGIISEEEYKFLVHITENYDTLILNSKRYKNLRRHLTKGGFFNERAIDNMADKEV